MKISYNQKEKKRRPKEEINEKLVGTKPKMRW